jgi:hypothetical protein
VLVLLLVLETAHAMPLDPTLPADHSPLSAAEMRAQLTAMKALIDAQAAEISSLQSQLGTVLDATSRNSNGVSPLGLTIANNPPQQGETQPIADKLDELINALRR